eukprot:11448310-Alexandrium_andersonii.AAC.1
MSASLVGSEMCIRDRARTAKPESQTTPRARGAGGRGREGPARAKHAQPVSYTHLTLPTICSV